MRLAARTALVIGTFAALVTTPTPAQGQQESALQVLGERVRITLTDNAGEVTGIVRSIDPKQLTLSQTDDQVRTVALSDIDVLERFVGQDSNDGRAAGIGAVAGFLLGGVAGVALESSICGSCDPNYERSFAVVGLAGALVGVVLGAAIGAGTSVERWESVALARPSPLMVTAHPRHSALRLGLSLTVPNPLWPH